LEGVILSQPVYGRIINYHIGIRTQKSDECLIQFPKIVFAAPAGQLVGRRVIWKGAKAEHAGRIIGLHGRNGVVIAKFTKGIPGQALGNEVKLIA
jgi:large subunit ribosomal protein L35Ae